MVQQPHIDEYNIYIYIYNKIKNKNKNKNKNIDLHVNRPRKNPISKKKFKNPRFQNLKGSAQNQMNSAYESKRKPKLEAHKVRNSPNQEKTNGSGTKNQKYNL